MTSWKPVSEWLLCNSKLEIFQCKLRYWWDDDNECSISENNDKLNCLAHYNYSETADKLFHSDTLSCPIANQSFLCLIFYVLVEKQRIPKDPTGDQINDLPHSSHWIKQEDLAILISPWNCQLIYNEYWNFSVSFYYPFLLL